MTGTMRSTPLPVPTRVCVGEVQNVVTFGRCLSEVRGVCPCVSVCVCRVWVCGCGACVWVCVCVCWCVGWCCGGVCVCGCLRLMMPCHTSVFIPHRDTMVNR